MGIYNIGTPIETSIAELARMMAAIAGKTIQLQSGNQLREGDATRRKPDISKLAALGYVPKISLIDGLKMMMGGSGETNSSNCP